MIYIVVAVHDRREITRRFLEAMDRQTVKDFRIILVDDGSTDGTAEMLAKDFSYVKTLAEKGDLWWTGSMRRGVDWVLDHGKDAEFIVCANNDQIPKEDAIEALLRTSRLIGNGVVGSVSRGFSDPKAIYDAAYAWNWKTDRYVRVPIEGRGYLAKGIDVLTCRLTIVPTEVFRRVNFRPELFPHYLGDHDFFMEAKKAGYTLALSYDSVVYDIGGPSGNYVANWKLTFSQLRENFFGIRSHGNVVFMTRYFMRHCPSLFFRAYFLLRLGLKMALRFFGALVTTLWQAVSGPRSEAR